MFRLLRLSDNNDRNAAFLHTATHTLNLLQDVTSVDFALTEEAGMDLLHRNAHTDVPIGLVVIDWQFCSLREIRSTADRILASDCGVETILVISNSEIALEAETAGIFADSEHIFLLDSGFESVAFRSALRQFAVCWFQQFRDRSARQHLNHTLSYQLRKLQSAKGKLEVQEKCLDTFFKQNPVAQAVVSQSNLAWLSCNDAFCRLTGWPSQPPPWGEFITDEKLTSELQLPDGVVTRHPLSLTLRQGSGKKQVFFSAVPTIFQDRDAYLLMFEDITTKVEIAAKIRTGRHIRAVEEMQIGMDHEINNLMTVSLGHLSNLLNEIDLPSSVRESLQAVRSTQGQLVNACRRWMRTDNAGLQASWQRPKDLLPSYTGLVTGILGEMFQVETYYPGNLPDMWADDAVLAELFLQLAHATRDSMPLGGQVFLSAEPWKGRSSRAGLFLHLKFSDTGATEGVTTREDDFRIALVEGAPTSDTGKRLLQASECAQRLGGWVECETLADGTNTVHAFLPAALSGDLEGRTPAKLPVPTPEGMGRTILVVEDEAPIRSLLTQILGHFGFKVLAAADAEEALALWRKADPGVIQAVFTDVAMPGGMTGLHLAALLLDEQPDLRIVVASGYSAEQLSRNDSFRHSTVFLPKPYELESVKKVLSGLFPPVLTIAQSAQIAGRSLTEPLIDSVALIN